MAATRSGKNSQLTADPETVLQEAQNIVYGDREKTYGHPSKNFRVTAEMWVSYLECKHGIRIPLDHFDVANMMVLLKVAREAHQHNRDNLVDGCGYFACNQKIRDVEGDD